MRRGGGDIRKREAVLNGSRNTKYSSLLRDHTQQNPREKARGSYGSCKMIREIWPRDIECFAECEG